MNSSAYLAARVGVRLAPGAADDDLGALDRPGDGRAVGELVVLAVEAEPLPRLGVPEAGEDRQLLVESVEPLAEAGERDAEVLVLALVPGGADAELGPAAAHLGDGRDLDRELAGKPEGGRVDERAEPDPLGLDGEARRAWSTSRSAGRWCRRRRCRGSGRSGRTRRTRPPPPPARGRGSGRRWPRGAVRGGSGGASAVLSVSGQVKDVSIQNGPGVARSHPGSRST